MQCIGFCSSVYAHTFWTTNKRKREKDKGTYFVVQTCEWALIRCADLEMRTLIPSCSHLPKSFAASHSHPLVWQLKNDFGKVSTFLVHTHKFGAIARPVFCSFLAVAAPFKFVCEQEKTLMTGRYFLSFLFWCRPDVSSFPFFIFMSVRPVHKKEKIKKIKSGPVSNFLSSLILCTHIYGWPW